MPVRILLLSNLFPPDVLGGYELLAQDVTKCLRSRGHDVHVLTSGKPRPDDPPYVHRLLELSSEFHHPASRDRLRHARIARDHERAASALLERGFDGAVVMSLRRLGFHAVRPIEAAGIRPVYCFNDDWLLSLRPNEGSTSAHRFANRMLEVGAFASRTWMNIHIDHAVYVSRSIRDALVAGEAPVPEGVVCFQGVDRKLFWKREGRVLDGPIRLLYAGRIHPTKGCDVAIRALGHLHRAGVNAVLSLAGTGHKEEMDRLAAIAVEEGVASRVLFLGFVAREKLGDVYRDSDVFLFPSLWEEPAGLTYLEAMACGVPVVAIARGGAKELLADRENCRVVEDEVQMASAITEVAEDPSLSARLVEGGIRTVERSASLERYVEAIEREVLASKQTSVSQFSGGPVVMNQVSCLKIRARRLDAAALKELVIQFSCFLETTTGPVALSFEDVEYIDSLGISVIVSLKRRAGARRMALVGMKGFVATVARVTHLADVFEMLPDVASAESVFAAAAP